MTESRPRRTRSFLIAIVIGVGAVALTIGAMVSSMRSAFSETCEVCVTFHGRTQCREAFAETRDDAIRTATDNACASLAAGMTDSIRCSNTRPDRVTCKP